MTPVTDTYIQMGRVHRAIARCRSSRLFRAARKCNQDEGTMAAARNVCVRQDREVEVADRALALERLRADLRVIGQVGDEENDRRAEGRDHHGAMLHDAAAADQTQPIVSRTKHVALSEALSAGRSETVTL